MPVAEDEDPVGALATEGTDPPFGDGVRTGSADRRADDRDLFRGEDGIETGDELGVSVADQETQPLDPIAKVGEQVAGLLGHPCSGRVGRDTGEVHRRVLNSMKNRTYSRRRNTVSIVKKSQAMIVVA
jgi:hypothetical protein